MLQYAIFKKGGSEEFCRLFCFDVEEDGFRGFPCKLCYPFGHSSQPGGIGSGPQ